MQNIVTNEGGPFGAIQKFSKKSLIVPKKSGNTTIAKGSLVCFRGSGRRFFFVLDELMRFRVF